MRKSSLNIILIAVAIGASFGTALAQHNMSKPEFRIHSHNDYSRDIPFYQAYSAKASCIECDMFYVGDDTFLVGHDSVNLNRDLTFERMYLDPVVGIFHRNGGHAWMKDPERTLTLMLETKSSDAEAYIRALEKKIKKHRDVFDPKINPHACRLIITGKNKLYLTAEKYLPYICFDLQFNEIDPSTLTDSQLERIGSFSMNFKRLSSWNGLSEFPSEQRNKVQEVIDAVHQLNKPVRFWGAPDTPMAWGTLNAMGADFINTDYPEECSMFASRRSSMMFFADSTRNGKPYSKDPHVIYFGGRYLIYYSIPPSDEKGVWGIGIAESSNLTSWNVIGEVRLPQNGYCAPCARVIDGKVHLFYQSYGRGRKDAVCHAVSTDGITFNDSSEIFSPEPSDWTCGRAIDAEVIKFRDKWFLYYATRDTSFTVQYLGVATADKDTDFRKGKWTEAADSSILKPEMPWEQKCIEGASVIERYGKLYMFYAGAYNCCPQQIGAAVSDDGITWKRLWETPFLENGKDGTWNSSESGHPHIFDSPDGRSYLFFQGNNDRGATWHLSMKEIIWRNGIPYIAD